ncbi:hypothetical protein KLF35_03990 [Clostridium perfringens]|uniref:hypothetical protein n=1 Tax=Clostridium perfringens TaxID=1502 RepID=UPI001CC9AB51|nr:hypothetical protein [Clostridium perfringens]UBK75912.1 hypothetical protein KLF35_03990 [Clostridium perfringens]
MFSNLDYESIYSNINQKAFDKFNDEIKIYLCHYKLISLSSSIFDIFDYGSRKKDTPLYDEIPEITYENLSEFIKSDKFCRLELRRMFINCYEIFESTIGEIIKYIHYNKPQLVLNKENKVNCDVFLKKQTKEEIVEDLINKNVNKIMYSNSVVESVRFIIKHSKSNIDNKLLEYLYACSKIRNAYVHNNGVINKEEYKKIKKYFEVEVKDIPEEFIIVVDDEIVGETINKYRKIISTLCDDLIK